MRELLAIVLSVLLRLTASDYPIGIFILLAILLSVLLRLTTSDYPIGIFKPFYVQCESKLYKP
jgi:hypothetical protein